MIRYNVICADPPWCFGDPLKMSKVKRGASSHYSTMSVEQLLDMGKDVKKISSENSILALWFPNSFIKPALEVMTAWGFQQKTIYTWVKSSKGLSGLAFGMGRQFRGCTEHALIGTRGRPKPQNRGQRNAEVSPALPHSVKPGTLQERLELMYPAPRLELFARRARPGWDCVGLESPDIPMDAGKFLYDVWQGWEPTPKDPKVFALLKEGQKLRESLDARAATMHVGGTRYI
jgi:N6-adenosine-specific RNA methylase IME4